MSSTIDWSKAPKWAGAVMRSRDGHLFYVAKFGVDGERQRLDSQSDIGIATFPTDHGWTLVETRPTESPAWNGEGLPPVGTVCEIHYENKTWRECEVVAHKTDNDCVMAVAWIDANTLDQSAGVRFRPARTPEHIAAEEREKACEAMLEIAKSRRPDPDVYEAIATLYDAGYRKVEQP